MKRTAHHRRIPRVIAVVSMESNFGPSVLRGVFAHVAERGEWGLSIVSPVQFPRRNVKITGEWSETSSASCARSTTSEIGVTPFVV